MLARDSEGPAIHDISERAPTPLSLLTWITFAVAVAILGGVLYVVWWSMSTESELCKQAAESALRRNASDAAMIHYMTSINGAMMKTRALCFAFVLIFLGSVYILSPIRTKFSFGLEHESVKGKLVSESPGLMMIALGVALTIIALKVDNHFESDNADESGSSAAVQIPAGSRTDYDDGNARKR